MAQKRMIWTQNGQKTGDRLFFGYGVLTKSVEDGPIILNMKYKPELLKLKKMAKTVQKPYFGYKMLNNLGTHFLSKIGLCHFYSLVTG